MANPASTFQRSFAGGELSPSLSARADLAKYQTGLRTCRNFMVQRQGGVANRAGLRYVATCKGGGDSATFLLRYVAEVAGDSILIEAGSGYLRFYKNGGAVTLAGVVAWNAGTNYVIGDIAVSGGVNYYCIKAHLNHVPPNATYWYAMPGSTLELPTAFGPGGFKWKQSGNTITLTSQLVPPYELIYVALTTWIIRAVTVAPAIDPPTALAAVGGGAVGALSYVYKVTSRAVDTFEESTPSAQFQLTPIGVPTAAQPNTLTWTPPAQPAAAYDIYLDPFGNGTFGFIGTATGAASFRDVGFLPDFSISPPQPRVLFNAAGDYPACSANYQQRRLFAGAIHIPDAIYGSRTGFPSNFSISEPLQDDDAITFRVAGNQHNPVRDMVGLKAGLIVLTDGGEWTIVGGTTKVLAPNSIDAEQDTYIGISSRAPVVIGNAILYVQARGSIIRELKFAQAVEGLAGRDLTLFAAHLFDGFTIDSFDFQQTPNSIVWAVRSDGTLLGLTYIPDQEIWGWHRHDTGAAGRFQSVCTIPEPGEDSLYVIVRRTINGSFVRYIERLERRTILNFNADSFFVDSGLTYTGAPATAIGGLTHLQGQVVAVVADGVVIFDGDPTKTDAVNYTVSGAGTIPHVLTVPASTIHAGLAIRYAEIELLDLDVEGVAVRDKEKRVGSVSLLLDASVRTFRAGPTTALLQQVKLQPAEAGLAGTLFTGQEDISTVGDYNRYGRVIIRQTDPLPLTILGVLPNLIVGG